jgi:hypothetical protein
MLEYGAYVALGLLVIWVALLFPLARGTLKAIPFGAASMFLALMIPFFWLGPEITELTILKVGSFKTNAQEASKYFEEIKTIRGKIDAEDHAINAAVASFDKEIATARGQIAQVTSQLAQAQKLTNDLENKEEYSNVARYNALGLLGLAGVGLKEISPLNDILNTYLHNDPNNFHWDCTREAINAYTKVIQLESKFPFSYYYRGGMQSGEQCRKLAA